MLVVTADSVVLDFEIFGPPVVVGVCGATAEIVCGGADRLLLGGEGHEAL
jgi:hypothetical protein